MADLKSVGTMYEVQRTLSKWQAVPVAGVLVSPIKALVSLAELVVGVAGAIFFGAPGLLLGNNTLSEIGFKAGLHAGLGLGSFIYSAVNMVTLTLVGYRIERMPSPAWNIPH